MLPPRCHRSAVFAATKCPSLPLQPTVAVLSKEGEVLAALARIIDPDFGMNIVDCGFIKDLEIDGEQGRVSFRMELTTPACPIKDDFEKAVGALRQQGSVYWDRQRVGRLGGAVGAASSSAVGPHQGPSPLLGTLLYLISLFLLVMPGRLKNM
jgi:metal-sulfur cluster biosynthetic enzyme